MEDTKKIARATKEEFGYVAYDGNLLGEFQNFDKRKSDAALKKKYDKYIEGFYPNKEPYKVCVGYERFLGP